MATLKPLILAAILALVSTAARAEPDNLFAVYITHDDPVVLERALTSAVNVDRYLRGKGEQARVEVVAAGSGIALLQEGSPLTGAIASAKSHLADIRFSVSAESVKAVAAKNGKAPSLLPEVTVVPSAAVRLGELRDQGYGSVPYSLVMRAYFARLLDGGKKSFDPDRSVAAAAPMKAPE
jgi:intracellular sulfur oxidation DsrE/DsrF family protein